jgi:hypothetical protein
MDTDSAGQLVFFLLPVEVEASSPGTLLNPVSVHKLARCLVVACVLFEVVNGMKISSFRHKSATAPALVGTVLWGKRNAA